MLDHHQAAGRRDRDDDGMSRTAVLMLDLQVDFLDSGRGRMPVDEAGSARVIEAARKVLLGAALPGAPVAVIVNAFPRSQRLRNFFRRNAAVAGSAGAALDPRLAIPAGTPVFAKDRPDAFSNPRLDDYLRSHGVTRVCIIGVFAEACVRATALGARVHGYEVCVPLEGIASNARWKVCLAGLSMSLHGISLPSGLECIGKE